MRGVILQCQRQIEIVNPIAAVLLRNTGARDYRFLDGEFDAGIVDLRCEWKPHLDRGGRGHRAWQDRGASHKTFSSYLSHAQVRPVMIDETVLWLTPNISAIAFRVTPCSASALICLTLSSLSFAEKFCSPRIVVPCFCISSIFSRLVAHRKC